MSDAGHVDAVCKPLGAADIRELARSAGVRPRKTFGQHFVVDPGVLRKIARYAELSSEDIALEIGPGFGSLTLVLLPLVRRLLAVEIDRVLAAVLPETIRRRCPAFADRLVVVHGDVLRLTTLPDDPTVLVANLPYNVAVPAVLRVFERFSTVTRTVIMVQREVAERLCADPGSPAYGAPSIKLRWYGRARIVGSVSADVFWPRPQVESAVVRIDRQPPPVPGVDRAAVFAVIDAAFAQRRKMLRRALSGWAGSAQAAEERILAAGLRPTDRGEALTLADFIRLAQAPPTR
ncbi:dimethyladenosine transferase [Acidothermus cellulolyticus 11B]|uniref:Ribosomal RNA small subunit methyltransferase A n=1 Tax=Acidothermus cellulolyticus (strain ATCC 43068 / DSM 8971 / 11B) TaxID=351607 RepID=RSMA_ACIC1|nr:16S rRNA (adenine(1518)-N(6)/adenine(1519)-N(6))-dimethyltransferase RsmA [Acidothermus cellulolyticus]A0LR93.1 RecName: Full=Ribosomal RNA small subunit methyltransferase A; AltName: Full=16S rRNA (adenine(1518)-N(6)/adenine(1519)-N(6))-dimethyltransferase; AltName: Full=16S rRNA dimethyladenosine transferase; AltName: Full=16S rRNA dimethylase; AltName: Full=S-adenosylmethionine-6-N', N'-adenosyl(rRNA) dimethyltransferase [Acidothermus cellulolyticus 11B]ABK51953.1 dimethyladenosine transfer